MVVLALSCLTLHITETHDINAGKLCVAVMGVVSPDAEIPGDTNTNTIVKHDEIMDLRHHSLNAIVVRHRWLWQPPSTWEYAHLQALCGKLIARAMRMYL
ncbi:hypothetical protein F5Y12DRAFT_169703 [Xylaria sp. FL1777]|nr:hypothetical protein F5Y12DRAFT_169703 [Xylaria sp. FL1777]